MSRDGSKRMWLADPLTPATPPASGVLCVITHRRLHCPALAICAMSNDCDDLVKAKLDVLSRMYHVILLLFLEKSKNKSRDKKSPVAQW